MNRIRKRSFKGIDYIRLSDLSEELTSEISNWICDDVLIKIKTDAGIERDCIQLKDFLYWFENLHSPVSPVQVIPSENTPVKKSAGLQLSLKA